MKILRKIINTSLISSFFFIGTFLLTILTGIIMLDLKDLASETIQVLSDWNTLDRITNDVLYYRLDSVNRLEIMEQEWIKAESELNNSFYRLSMSRWINILPGTVSQNLSKADYIWRFSRKRLLSAQDSLSEMIHGKRSSEVILELDKTTFYEKLLYLIEKNKTSYEEAGTYRQFLSNMSVLDITSTSFSGILTEINSELPQVINTSLLYLIFIVAAGLVLIITVSLVSSRRIIQPIVSMARAVRQMGDGDYQPLSFDEDDELGIINEGFNRMSQRIHLLYDENLSREKEKRSAQFKALQYRMNPHFLYNTLSSLQMSAVINGNREIAENLKALSRLLRKTINRSGHLITVGEEASIAEDYICIMQTRYKNRISFSMNLPENVKLLSIPALIFQPLLENAILHGLNRKLNTKEEAILNVSASCEDHRLKIVFFDNGCGIKAEKKEEILAFESEENETESVHIGLKNINDRIRLLYGEEYGMKIESEEEKYTRIILTLPEGATQ